MCQPTWTALALSLGLLLPGAADAQQQFRRVKIDREKDIQVGFQNVNRSSDAFGFKAGMWTPVLIKFTDDEDGNFRFPVEVDGSIKGEITVEVADNDGVHNTYSQKFSIGPNEPLQVLTYTKVSSTGPELKVTIKSGDKKITLVNTLYQAMDVGSHMYLALGDNLLDLNEALVLMANPNARNDPNSTKDTKPRYAVFENDVKNLPALWFGYDPVDLAILTTANDKFVDRLLSDRQSSPQLAAVAEWVRRGGRLVISVAPSSREKVHRLLASPAWQPALPPVLTVDSKAYNITNLDDFNNWVRAQGQRLNPKAKDG